MENDWTAHEVRDLFHWIHAKGMTLHNRTDGEWEDLAAEFAKTLK